MSDYLKAYRERLERNHAELIKLINDVQAIDSTIEAYVYDNPNRLLSGVVFIKEEEINSIHFHETPYRWSGCGYPEFGNSHYGTENSGLPFTANDVIANFEPIKDKRKSQIEKFRNKEHYLNWCSYLTKFNPNNVKTQGHE